MSRKPPFRSKSIEIDIVTIGARGDGLARYDDEQVFVPLTVPGDHVMVRLEGRRGDGLTGSVVTLLSPGPDRAEAPCDHFGLCGGCSLQHLVQPALENWKRDRLVTALGRVGIAESLIKPLVAIAPGTRRRAAFAFLRLRAGVVLGFNERSSHKLVEVDDCLLLTPAILALLPPLRELLAQCLPQGGNGDVVLTAAESGVDLVIQAEAKLDLFLRETLASFAEKHDLARLTWQSEPVAHRRPAIITMGGVPVSIPPGGFLQPCAEGEAALVSLVLAALPEKGPIADLFAGSGSFTLPIAKRGHAVHAVEGDEQACRALDNAARQAAISVTVEQRDLALRPVLPPEMKNLAALVFDPPRVGAASQAEQIAKGGPPVVVAVSCNPATLARDAATLMGGGYKLIEATPVDQFPWSAHLEAVAVFKR